MIVHASIILLVACLTVVSAFLRRYDRALAFFIILCGVMITPFLPRGEHTVPAFALWTLVAYLLRRYPLASALYLASAICYILKLQGNWWLPIQIVSNIAGFAGLAAVWYGGKRDRPVGEDRPRGIWLMALVHAGDRRMDSHETVAGVAQEERRGQ